MEATRPMLRLLALMLFALGAAGAFWAGWQAPLGAALFRLDPGLLNTAQAGIQRHVSPWLWDAVVLPVLEQPVWLVPAILAGLLLLLGTLPRRR
jgi:hypothetical protein